MDRFEDPGRHLEFHLDVLEGTDRHRFRVLARAPVREVQEPARDELRGAVGVDVAELHGDRRDRDGPMLDDAVMFRGPQR